MSFKLPAEIANPLKELLQADAEPILGTFLGQVQGAASSLVAKLPASTQPAANLGSQLLIAIAGIALQGELQVLLNHNSHLQGSTSAPLPTLAQPPQPPSPAMSAAVEAPDPLAEAAAQPPPAPFPQQ